MRILHILDHSIPLHSGYTFRTRAILEHQRAMGWETIHITSPKHRGDGELTEMVDGFKFYRTPPLRSFSNKLPVVNQWAVSRNLEKRLDEVIAEVRPDILHAHSPALNGLAAIRAGRRHRIPVVYECRAFWEDAAVDHGTTTEGSLRYHLTRALETHVFKNAGAVTTICEGLRQDIIARGLPDDKVTVIPNAVDIQRFTLNRQPDLELKRSLGLEDKIVLGFIGSFYAYEGLSLLLDALPGILVDQPEVRLLLVGGGPQEEALHVQSEALNLSEYVRFTGRVPHNQVQKFYDLVDIFVYPRLSMRLTELVTPLKPLEAMAQGKLVLASNVGGHRELIKNGETGILFPAGDIASFAENVTKCVTHREKWQKIIRDARDFVKSERNWQKSVMKYLPIYKSLVKYGCQI